MKSINNVHYQLKESGEFVIGDYNSSKLFSSFFPGVAGKEGIPMWTFYVNRGQCICSMGIEGKHNPIMEFLPANQAYNLVTSQGFRTFVKLIRDSETTYYEPFQKSLQNRDMKIDQRMIINPARLILEEINHTLKLKFTVEYFNVPQDRYAGLIRKLHIENLGDETIRFEALDGLPLIIPYGLDNGALKFIRRLVEAFVEVKNHENKAPLFKGKVEPHDRPEVVHIKKGNFYLGFVDGGMVDTIVDPVRIFGIRGDYQFPERFLEASVDELVRDQILENRLPSAMGCLSGSIEPGKIFGYTSIIGQASSAATLNHMVPEIATQDYVNTKYNENRNIIAKLTQNNFICSQEPVLDHYARMNFLDNTLRGGFPYTFKGSKESTTLYLYSRKHGDLERDYNDYRLMPTPYSQGNGNFRDVNQNRRCDLWFNPDVRDGNIEHFYNLIQLDGYNPLVIKDVRFKAPEQNGLEEVLRTYFDKDHVPALKKYIQNPFTPGELILFLREEGFEIKGDSEQLLGDLMSICEKDHDADFGEGYWIDHWTYNIDLLENYLSIYPEQKQNLLFEKKTFTFYDSPHHVTPRDDKYVLWDGKPMQLNSVEFDEEHNDLIESRTKDRHQMHTAHGTGEVYRTTLFNKMLCLVVNKLASLDPNGVGIEMESDKPDWYDALNGMPALIGSSLNETLELKRLILFALQSIEEINSPDRNLLLFTEIHAFLVALAELLAKDLTPFAYWNQATALKENYRDATRMGISGEEKPVSLKAVKTTLQKGLERIEDGIARAWNDEQNVISTYFINHVTSYEPLFIEKDVPKKNAKGLLCFRATGFKQTALPLFLEGPVHYLRCSTDRDKSRELVQNIRQSGLFDQKLEMYKVNEKLTDQPMEIGRARTFSPGWFENESIWLHMEYKYMLEILRNDLHDEFFQDFKNVCVPFMKPEVYGRSILENSSFIVSSANPDPSIHGNGFVARLSGATAEFINILMFMVIGKKPFSLDENGELELHLNPVIPQWLFTEEEKTHRLFINGEWTDVRFEKDTFSFIFLGETLVTYHNPQRKDTFGKVSVAPVSYSIEDKQGNVVKTDRIVGELAEKIRKRDVVRIRIDLA